MLTINRPDVKAGAVRTPASTAKTVQAFKELAAAIESQDAVAVESEAAMREKWFEEVTIGSGCYSPYPRDGQVSKGMMKGEGAGSNRLGSPTYECRGFRGCRKKQSSEQEGKR